MDATDQVIVRSKTEIEHNGQKATVTQTYQPPLDGRPDLYAEYDMSVARGIGELLNKHYFAYTWKSFADMQQGIVGFSIPDLMGDTLHMVINLKTHDALDPQLIVEKAGELLERMKLPRGAVDMAAYSRAKANKHLFDFADVRSH